MKRIKIIHWFIIGIFTLLYFFVATMSMINSVTFFNLSHSDIMSWSLAIAWEVGAAASLASIIIMEKMNKIIVWSLFWVLTLFQAMSNSFDAYMNLHDYYGWIELFGLTEEDPLFQKRILSVLSGGILPLVALGFIKSLADYLKPNTKKEENELLPLKEIKHSPEQPTIQTPILVPANILEKKEQKKTLEEKMYDSMLKEDKQKILDFIKGKTDDVNNNIKSEIHPPIIKEEIKPEPVKEQTQLLPGPLSSELINKPLVLGIKGSKWAGKNRPKHNPI